MIYLHEPTRAPAALETEAIRRAIGEPSFSRGHSYYRLGAVRTVEFVPPDWVRARVQGTAPQPYGVSVTLESDPAERCARRRASAAAR